MPRYHALNTAIKLCVWDTETDNTKRNGGNNTSADLGASAHGKYNATSQPEANETYGPSSTGCIVHDLKEKYFEGHEGVDFLDPGMPFYLVKAGSELFASTADQAHQPHSDFQYSTPTKDHGHNRHSSQSSSLSSIDTALLLTPEGGSFSTPRQAKQGEHPAIVEDAGSTPISTEPSHKSRNATAFPIAIKLDLSQRSFLPSINTGLRQELCLTIFYNGELTHSRLLRPNTLGSLLGPVCDEKYQYYSGRRIDTWIEVPWVINTRAATAGAEGLGFEDRWNKINRILLAEADEWGQYGMFRSPMGEYLEELSKQPAPDLKEHERLGGSRAGIIDVVITLGRTVTSAISGLRAPRRKLHEDRCGKNRKLVVVPEELGPKQRAKIVAEFDFETPQTASQHLLQHVQRPKIGSSTPQLSRPRTAPHQPFQNHDDNEMLLDERSGKTAEQIVAHHLLSRAIPPNTSPSNDFIQNQSPETLFIVADRGRSRHRKDSGPSKEADRREPIKTPESKRRRASSLPPSSPFPHQHPNQPHNLPQKRFKGSYPKDNTPKRRKLENEMKAFGCFSLDSAGPTSSMRSKRATSSPATPRYFADIFQSQPTDGGRRSRLSKDAIEESPTRIYRSTQNMSQATTNASIPATEDATQSRTSMPSRIFGFDGSTDESRYFNRPRSSTGSSQSCQSASQSAIGSVNETPATSVNDFPRIGTNGPAAPVAATRIVFTVENQEAASISINREKFDALDMHSPILKDGTNANQSSSANTSDAHGASNIAFALTSKLVTANHPSQQAKRRKIEAGAEIPSQNADPSTQLMAGSGPISNKNSTRRKSVPLQQKRTPSSRGGIFDGSSGNPVGDESMPNKTSRPRAKSVNFGRKTVPAVIPAANGSMGGKTLPALMKVMNENGYMGNSSEAGKDARKGSNSTAKTGSNAQSKQRKSLSSAKQSDDTQEDSAEAKTSSKAQSKSRSASESSRKKKNTVSEESKVSQTLPKSQPRGKRDSISSRELKDILTPHKGSGAVDASFGSSFKEKAAETPTRARSARKSKPTIAALEAAESSSSTKAGSSGKKSADIAASVMGQNPKSRRKASAPSHAIPDSSNEEQQRADEGAAKFLEDAIQAKARERQLSGSRALKSLFCPVPKPNFLGDIESHDSKPSATATQEKSVLIRSAQNTSPQLPISGRPARRYSVDSQGKKMPAPKSGSMVASSPLSHAEGPPYTPTAATPMLTFASGYSDNRFPTSTSAQQNGQSSTAADTTKPTPSAPPKMSISETVNLRAPIPLAASFAHIKTAAQVGAKRVAEDHSSRFWKPTSLCDNSVLTYASGKPLPGMDVDPVSGHVYRTIKAEREGVFRASGVLMGVRFVVGI